MYKRFLGTLWIEVVHSETHLVGSLVGHDQSGSHIAGSGGGPEETKELGDQHTLLSLYNGIAREAGAIARPGRFVIQRNRMWAGRQGADSEAANASIRRHFGDGFCPIIAVLRDRPGRVRPAPVSLTQRQVDRECGDGGRRRREDVQRV